MSEPISPDGRRSGNRKLRNIAVPAALVVAAAGAGFVWFQNGAAPGGPGQGQPAAGPSSSLPVCKVLDRSELVPQQGALFGVDLDTHAKSLYGYSFDLGHKPAVTVHAVSFPYSEAEKIDLDRDVVQAREYGQMVLLALEPAKGLDAVTGEAVETLAKDLNDYNAQGVPVIVSFAPDMNGGWNPWAQQPERYINAFETVASSVHANAPGSAMMWAPTYGGGYPFSGGGFEAKPGSPDYSALDTDADGSLTAADDPYAPYYPGDEATDWVGMTLMHWGTEEPWNENELPENNKVADQLTGNYLGNGDESQIPDFYQVYGGVHGKPVAIAGTGAMYKPGAGGADELAIKQAWWGQLFSEQIPARFPQLKMINWVEWERDETEAGGKVDWRVTSTPQIRDAFVAALPAWLQYRPAENCRPAE